jgi:hypothetical protein
MIDLFFSRSGHYPLHIYLPTSMIYPAQILSIVQNRLKCLSIEESNDHVIGCVFPILDRLTLHLTYTKPTEISHLNTIQFPSLRHLLCDTFLTNSISGSSGVTEWKFPPLQTLSLIITSDLAWLCFLTAVKNTLISLRLYPIEQCTIQNPQIDLPALRCLDIRFSRDVPLFWPLDLKTPVLETYLERTRRSSSESLLHEDTQNVRELRSDRTPTPTLSYFPLLEILQLHQDYHIFAVWTELASNESLCPNLQKVELKTYKDRLPSLSTKLADVNRSRHVPVNVEVNYPSRESCRMPSKTSRYVPFHP